MKRDSRRFLILTAILSLAAYSCDSTSPSIPVASVTVEGTPVTIPLGGTLQLTVTTRDAAGKVLTGRAVAWTSDNDAVVSVSTTGWVTGVSAGTATVAATSEGTTGTGDVSVSVARSVPAAPTNVTASAGPDYNAITVGWTYAGDATSYNVYWGTTAGVTPQNGTKVANVYPGFVHTGLTPMTTYEYVVTGVNDLGEGVASAATRTTASGDIGLFPCLPTRGDGFGQGQPPSIVGSQFSVAVSVVSRFQLSSVKASASGRSTDLAFQAKSRACSRFLDAPAWVGTLSLAGLPKGPMTLTFSATDVFGNAGEASVWIDYDEPPTLTIAAPEDFSVARPNLRIAASCQDDDPRGCFSLTVSLDAGPPILSAQADIDQTISLGYRDGQDLVLTFAGRDSRGQVTTAYRRVFVESSTQLNEVANVGGLIWDVLPDRILFLDQSNGGNALTIRDRSLGSDVVIYDQVGHIPQSGFLTPLGAMFFEQSGAVTPTGVLHEWQPGSLTDLGQSSLDLVVKGRYALFEAAGLTRRDVVAGVNTVVALDAGNVFNDLAANGDVVYWTDTPSFQVFRFRNGASTQLTSDATLRYTYPVTDGINVVYRKQSEIAVYDASGEHVLTPGDLVEKSPGRDYRAANGWVAYTKSGSAGELQVWSRSPTGQELQVSSFGTSSSIDALGPNGEVVLINRFGPDSRRYLAVPNYSSSPRDISSSIGSAFFQNGSLFITIGRSVYQVIP